MSDREFVNLLAVGDAEASYALGRRVANCVREHFPFLMATEPLINFAEQEIRANQFRGLRQRGESSVDSVILSVLRKVLAVQLTNIKLIYRHQLSVEFINIFSRDEQVTKANLESFAIFFQTYFDNTEREAACVSAYFWPEHRYTDAAARQLHRLATPDGDGRFDPVQLKRYAGQVADYRKRGSQKIRSTLQGFPTLPQDLEEIFFMMDFCEMTAKSIFRMARTAGVRALD